MAEAASFRVANLAIPWHLLPAYEIRSGKYGKRAGSQVSQGTHDAAEFLRTLDNLCGRVVPGMAGVQ